MKQEFNLKQFLTENKLTTTSRLLSESIQDISSTLKKAGFDFQDGLLGGVGSGGAGYYDQVNDKMDGYNQKGPWDEEYFSKWYDSFSKDTFTSFLSDAEDLEDMGVDPEIVSRIKPGIYSIEDKGYAEISQNGGIEIFSTPMLAPEDDSRPIPIFKMDEKGRVTPQISKDELRKKIKDEKAYIL